MQIIITMLVIIFCITSSSKAR